MSKKEQVKTVLLYAAFIGYMVLLIKILFLSRVSIGDLFDSQRAMNRSVNLVPFHSIMDYLSGGSEIAKRFAFGNVFGNIVLFVPLGIYLPLLKRDKRTTTNLLLIFLLSLFTECTQYLFGIGVSDVDDIILNCMGGLIGILLYRFSSFALRGEKNARTAITILSVVIGMPVVYYYLFMIKMRF